MSIRIKKKSKLYKLIEEPNLMDLIMFGFLGASYTNLLVLNKLSTTPSKVGESNTILIRRSNASLTNIEHILTSKQNKGPSSRSSLKKANSNSG